MANISSIETFSIINTVSIISNPFPFGERRETFLPGLIDWLVGLDENSCAFAVHRHSSVVVEDVATLIELTVPPNLQMCLASEI